MYFYQEKHCKNRHSLLEAIFRVQLKVSSQVLEPKIDIFLQLDHQTAFGWQLDHQTAIGCTNCSNPNYLHFMELDL